MIEVVGIGADGWGSLDESARDLVASAAVLVGGLRQLDLIPLVPDQQRVPWPTNLRAALPDLVGDHERQALVVLASGDPLMAGVGTTLIEVFGAAAVRIHPQLSSVTLARARMGWAAETVDITRLTSRDAAPIRRGLAPGRRLLILSRDATSPAAVAAELTATGFGPSRLTVLSELGTEAEQRVVGRADAWSADVSELNVVCVECVAERTDFPWSVVPGLPDDAYAHDGQLTKRDVRAAALAHLAPVPGQLLWDVGAGAGSVGIEWLRVHPACRAIAIERDATRVARIRANARDLGVGHLTTVHGGAPQALAGLPRPDAVFVGGGGTAETLDLAWSSLRPGGRLVAHAVTIETELVLTEQWRRRGGELTRLAVEHLESIGGYHGWKPARAVVQWSGQKPLDAR